LIIISTGISMLIIGVTPVFITLSTGGKRIYDGEIQDPPGKAMFTFPGIFITYGTWH